MNSNNQFELYYQPIISLSTGRISGFEALLRWHNPERGLVSPLDFVPIAEDTGLILTLGNWVLRQACQQIQTWQSIFPATPLVISVNFSVKQFLQPNLFAQINQILRETNLNPRFLKIEITESAIIENFIDATVILKQLQELHIGLAIDDFGTGYSSLSRLQSLRVDTLKIDRSFINQMGVAGDNAEIVQAIIMLARSIGISVTAEGVETAGQLAKLRELNCEEAQGYFLARPLSADAAEELIAASPQW